MYGKDESGLISWKEMGLLLHWIDDGYIILPNAVPSELVTADVGELDRAYAGGYANLLFECPSLKDWAGSMNLALSMFYLLTLY